MTLESKIAHDPVDRLAEDFLARYRRGERPSISEYARQFPDVAGEVADVIQVLLLMENLGAEQAESNENDVGPLPKQLGEYRIVRELGRGGMGVVYEAVQEELGRHVALKVLPSAALLKPSNLERFRREAMAAARLHHSSIIPVFGVGAQDGIQFYAMQHIQGQGLDAVLKQVRQQRTEVSSQETLQDRQVSTQQSTISGHSSRHDYALAVARIGHQMADALAHAHSQGVLHRDIKPGNILLDQEGRAWLSDFGLAQFDTGDQLTGTGEIVGTLRYMAPERFNRAGDPRSDIYSLGVTLYEMITLLPAFQELDRTKLIHQILKEDPIAPRKIDPSLPRDLETIILKAITREPEQRYHTAQKLAEDLDRFLTDRPVTARRLRWWERSSRWVLRNPLVASCSMAFVVFLIAALLTTYTLWQRAASSDVNARRHLAAEHRNLNLAISAVEQFSTKVSNDLRMKEHDWRPLRQELLKTAVDFHEQLLELRDNTTVARIDLARAYFTLATLTAEIDDSSRALELYQMAVHEFDAVLAEHPDELQHSLALSICLERFAHLLADTGDPAQAEAILQRTIGVLESILTEEPAEVDARAELARTFGLQAYVAQCTGQLEAASAGWRAAIGQWELLRVQQPDVMHFASELAHAHLELGLITLAGGIKNWRSADAELVAAYEILKPIMTDGVPGDSEWRSYLNVLVRRGEIAKVTGRFDESRTWLGEAIAAGEKLAEQNPSALNFRHDLASAYLQLGQCEGLDGNHEAAKELVRKAVEIGDRLTNQAPGNIVWESNLGKSLGYLANLAIISGDPENALEHCNRSVDVLENALTVEPRSRDVKRFLADVLAIRATLHADSRRFAQALLDWDRLLVVDENNSRDWLCLKRAWTVVNMGDYESAETAARESIKNLSAYRNPHLLQEAYPVGAKVFAVAAGLANEDSKKSEAERFAEADQCSITAVEMIRLALDSGIENSTEFRSVKEFDILRDRPDFIALFED